MSSPISNIRSALAFASVCVGFALAACHNDDIGHDSPLVGGFCRDERDCIERCVRGDDFPEGTCTVDCRSDADCPGGSFCIDTAGGICLLPCATDDECRPSYECETRAREGRSGEAAVCIDQ